MIQTGAVLVFKPGVSVEEAKKLLDKLDLEWKTVQTFDPDWGSPVFYIP